MGLAGLSLLLFAREGQPAAAVSVEIYRLVSSPVLPAIPLLNAYGYVLAESDPPAGACASSARRWAGCRAGSP